MNHKPDPREDDMKKQVAKPVAKALLTKEAKGKEQGRLASEWVEANIL